MTNKAITGVWHNIAGIRHELTKLGVPCESIMRKQINSGTSSMFWWDKWIGVNTLKELFPNLYQIEKKIKSVRWLIEFKYEARLGTGECPQTPRYNYRNYRDYLLLFINLYRMANPTRGSACWRKMEDSMSEKSDKKSINSGPPPLLRLLHG